MVTLIRWCHPDKGLIPAAQFIGPAEQAGLMNALDHVVMDKSCAAIRALIDHGVKNPRISINISTAQLCDPNVSSRLQCHMDAHGVSQQHLRLELLETTLLDERSSVIVENVHRLIAHGFSVELDDFGTGYAAIGTLRAYSGVIRPVIPKVSGHPFRFYPATGSGASGHPVM